MKRVATAAVAACVLGGVAAQAHAQGSTVPDVVEGAGIKVGEGTVIHPVLGIESGIVYNVFYEESDASPRMSGLLRVIGQIAVGSLPQERMQMVAEEAPSTHDYGDLAFRFDANAEYEEYLSGDELIRAHRNLSGGLQARGLVFPRRTWQFWFSDDFRRETRPVNFESAGDVDRDINRIGLELRYRPEGRALSGGLRYQNIIDYFEADEQQFANRIGHTIGAEVRWQWLPVTRVYADASFGFFGGFGDASTRPSSNPLRISMGIQSALTVKSSVNARIGFSKAWYDTGPDFMNVIGGIQFGYRFSTTGRFAAMYEYDYQDSINANFYRDHAIKAQLEQVINRIGFHAGAELRFRLYEGVISEVMGSSPNRNDIIFAVPFGAAYNFRDWIAATIDYRFQTVQTDFRYFPEAGMPDDPSYTRHSLLAGVRAAY